MNKGFAAAILCTCVLTLTACGGGSETDDGSAALSRISDERLKSRAFDNFGDNLNDGVESSNSATTQSVDVLAGETSVDETPVPSGSVDITDTDTDADTETVSTDDSAELVDDEAFDLIRASLSLGDEQGERTTRDGNRLTIDPDEVEVCAADESQENTERCEILVRDMTVVLDAATETSGLITYLFQDHPVVSLGYSETTDSVEVFLEGLKILSDAEDALDPLNFGEASTSDIATGAIRLSATTNNVTPGAVAGSVSLDVTESVRVESATDSSLSIDTGTLLAITFDEAEDTARIQIDAGKTLMTSRSSVDDEDSIETFDLEGLTVIIDTGLEGDSMIVSNLSLGRGPFRLTVDNELVTELSLETLGFTVRDNDGAITIDTDLDFRSFISETVAHEFGDTQSLQTILEVTAPRGSMFHEQDNGSLRVLQGGPLIYTLSETVDDGNADLTMVEVVSGQCFDDEADPEQSPALVACD